MSRQAVETLNTYIKDVEHGDMIQAFNRQHISSGVCPTLTTRPEGFKTATLVVENILCGESDNLAETYKQYDADEQADFTQTEAEEWATEFAIREKEGSPVPREIERKTYEQHSFTYASLFSGI